MSKEFFYTMPLNIHGSQLVLTDEEARHVGRVLRKTVGDRIWVTDGRDRAFESSIRAITDREVHCEILSAHLRLHEPAIDVTLAVGVLKQPARMDWIFEKGTEIGIRRFVPLRTTRCIPHADKQERWRHLALAAMKQSCRSYLPEVDPLTDYTRFLDATGAFNLRIVCHEEVDAARHIADALRQKRKRETAVIVIGPEGGLTDEEAALAGEKGFIPVSLGGRRLRTETAAVVAAAWVVGAQG